MEVIKFILSAVATVGVAGAIYFLRKYLSGEKAQHIIAQTKRVFERLTPFIIQAEALKDYTGEEKKQWAMRKVEDFALEMKLPFDREAVSKEIDRLVAFTKKVNVNKKNQVK